MVFDPNIGSENGEIPIIRGKSIYQLIKRVKLSQNIFRNGKI